jgi:hypothetical protein
VSPSRIDYYDDPEITGIIGIYSDPKHVILYTSNGEVRQEFSIVLTARPPLGTFSAWQAEASCA